MTFEVLPDLSPRKILRKVRFSKLTLFSVFVIPSSKISKSMDNGGSKHEQMWLVFIQLNRSISVFPYRNTNVPVTGYIPWHHCIVAHFLVLSLGSLSKTWTVDEFKNKCKIRDCGLVFNSWYASSPQTQLTKCT